MGRGVERGQKFDHSFQSGSGQSGQLFFLHLCTLLVVASQLLGAELLLRRRPRQLPNAPPSASLCV